MKKSSHLRQALLSTLGVLAYVTLVAWIMSNGERLVSPMKGSLLGPVMFLTLFVTSAAMVGLLIFGRPAYLFFSGHREDAMKLVIYTVSSLVVTVLLIFFLLAAAAPAFAPDLGMM